MPQSCRIALEAYDDSGCGAGLREQWVDDETQIPSRVRELLVEKVRSIEELEILVWFHEHPAPRSAAQLANELKLSATTTADALARLLGNQMIDVQPAADGSGHFRPSTQAAAVVAELARTYENLRVEMLVLISGNAIGRVRRGALQTFSEAFRLRGDKKNG